MGSSGGVQFPGLTRRKVVGRTGRCYFKLNHEAVMPRYLCLQRTLSDGAGQKPSPSQMEQTFARFEAWQNEFKDQLTDMGGRLGEGTLVTADAETDGPFVEVKELIGGYMIVDAGSLDEAAEVARACPGLVRPGSGVEVVEIQSS